MCVCVCVCGLKEHYYILDIVFVLNLHLTCTCLAKFTSPPPLQLYGGGHFLSQTPAVPLEAIKNDVQDET